MIRNSRQRRCPASVSRIRQSSEDEIIDAGLTAPHEDAAINTFDIWLCRRNENRTSDINREKATRSSCLAAPLEMSEWTNQRRSLTMLQPTTLAAIGAVNEENPQ